MGEDHFLISKDQKQMQDTTKSLDYIIDTVSAHHPLLSLLRLLKVNGKLVLVGMPEKPLSLRPTALASGRRFVGSSTIGGVKETQEMLEFCGKHGISCMIENIPIDYVNTAMERLGKGDVKYRFVIDMARSFSSPTTD